MKSTFKCVVTGGAGFIGSHLCNRLLNSGAEVFCIDNLITGDYNNISPLSKNSKFHFIKHDVIRTLPAKIINQFSGVKYLYHLASPASPPLYRKFAIETLLVNSSGTYQLLEIAKNLKAKFLLASTSEVYGDPQEHPQKETYNGNVNPVGLRACYDESKRFAESLTIEFVRKFKLNACIIRIFNTYGPNMKILDGRVISNFVNQAICAKPLTVYGDGFQTRSFCYIDDMIDGLVEAMENNITSGSVINLGNPKEYTIIDLARLIIKLTNSKSTIDHRNLRLGDDPQQRKPDINRAKKILDWQPKISLTSGLTKTIDYFRKI